MTSNERTVGRGACGFVGDLKGAAEISLGELVGSR